ncbi:MAG: DMT family transporter [Candidatus Gracilibacteria bacterium]|nr:DMT family transporter [Candidatus Gracilibacteria bacterium]
MKNKIISAVGAISIIVAAMFWSLDGILIRPNFYEFPAVNIVFLEHLLGTIILSPFLFLGFKKLKNLNKKDLFALLWVCFFGGLVGTVAITEAFFSAFRGDNSLSIIVILQKLQPIFALFLASILLKEKLNIRFYLLAIVSIISAYLIVFPDITVIFSGIDKINISALYALIAAFSFGSSTIFGKTLVSDLGFKLSTSLRFTITTILAFFALLLFGDFFYIGQLQVIHWELLGIIVFTSGAFAMFLYYFGLKRVKASTATILELAWPLSSIYFDYIFNHKVLSSSQFFFSIVLIVCFFLIIKEGRKLEK